MISVCIATYNGEKYIKRQLQSILIQLDDCDEVIVSDDGSSDDTLNIINGIRDPRIKIFEGPKKGSPISNFENAIKHSHGEYIFLSDQDDIWVKNKITISLKYLKQYDCIVSDCIVMDKDSRCISNSFYSLNKTHYGKLYNLVIKNGYLGCCMAFKRNIIETVLPFPSDIPMHDIWIGCIAAFRYKLKFIPDKLIYFYRHNSNISTTASKSKSTVFQKLVYRYAIIKNLINRK